MSKKLNTKALKGFTIIEVMIVLAIAGLIMVVVLVAVPQLQRSQRDSARQSVLSRINTELNTFAGNNDGRYPFTTLADFETRYLGTAVDRRNPSTGTPYTIGIASSGTAQPAAGQILLYPGMGCSGESTTGTLTPAASRANERRYAMKVQLERAGVYYCIDNNN